MQQTAPAIGDVIQYSPSWPGRKVVAVGHVLARAGTKITENNREVAAWWHTIEAVEDTRVDVVFHPDGSMPSFYGSTATTQIPGICVAYHYPTLFGGVAIGQSQEPDRIGTAMDARVSSPLFAEAQWERNGLLWTVTDRADDAPLGHWVKG